MDLTKEETPVLDRKKDAAAESLEAAISDIEGLWRSLLSIHDALPETAEERSRQDLGRALPRATVIRAAIQHLVASFRTGVAELREAAAYRQGKLLPGPGSGGKNVSCEEMQRRLYDLVVEQEFTPKAGADPDDTWVPPYTAEEAGLKVTYHHGRWLAEWRKLEVPDTAPEEEQWELLCLRESEDEPGSVYFQQF